MAKQETKEILTQAWAAVFGTNEIAEDANFFEMGGDSVKAVQLLTWLAQKGLKMDLMSVFTKPVLKDQLEALTESAPISIDGFQQAMNMKHTAQKAGWVPPMPQAQAQPQQAQQPQQMCTP